MPFVTSALCVATGCHDQTFVDVLFAIDFCDCCQVLLVAICCQVTQLCLSHPRMSAHQLQHTPVP